MSSKHFFIFEIRHFWGSSTAFAEDSVTSRQGRGFLRNPHKFKRFPICDIGTASPTKRFGLAWSSVWILRLPFRTTQALVVQTLRVDDEANLRGWSVFGSSCEHVAIDLQSDDHGFVEAT